MRKYNKFKFVNRFYIYPYFFHNRIFQFKRPKWLGAQKKILNLQSQIKTLQTSQGKKFKKNFFRINKEKQIKKIF